MKKTILILQIIGMLIIFGCNQNSSSTQNTDADTTKLSETENINTELLPDLAGEWVWESETRDDEGTPESMLSLNIQQNNQTISGGYDAFAMYGDRLDFAETSYSCPIEGSINKGIGHINFTSCYSGEQGKAEISINKEGNLEWKVTKQADDSWCPQQATLKKRTEKELNKTISNEAKAIIGSHSFGLQWIDGVGKAKITEHEGRLKIQGKYQKSEDYIEIDGYLEYVNAKELIFDGIIKSKVSYINSGEECIKDGTYTFKSTKNRKYWRLQEMANCEDNGNGSVDYVDLYF